LKQISNIQNVFVLFIVVLGSTLIHQQIYALKQYVDDEYNIKFEYSDNWTINKVYSPTFTIDHDIITIVEGRPSTQSATSTNENFFPLFLVTIYTDIPDIETLKREVKKEILLKEFEKIESIDRHDFSIGPVYFITSNYEANNIKGVTTESFIIHKDNVGYKMSIIYVPGEITDQQAKEVGNMQSSIFNNLYKTVN
jgi:hypothetical protein